MPQLEVEARYGDADRSEAAGHRLAGADRALEGREGVVHLPAE